MTLFRCIVLAAALVANVAQATSLGYEQRQAFDYWRKQQQHGNRLSTRQTSTACESAVPVEGLTERLNAKLASGGENYILSLCPNTTYPITDQLMFASRGQEISTLGYPIDESRAVLLVNGSTATDGTGHSTAIQAGGCPQCAEIKIRNIQINGNRRGAPPINGGANMELGGPGGGQLIEYVKTFDPRGWSCLHIAEGVLDCTNATIRHNDIGPCGSDTFNHWADGVSLSCRNSQVHDNWIVDPTDGGIVIFQSPGSLIQNNTIWIENSTCLGGINLVDYDPFSGNYTGVMVRNNTIIGGYANTPPTDNSQFANNTENAIIKIGIAVGLRVWFGAKWGDAAAFGGAVMGNRISGAFGFGIAVSGVKDFTVAYNTAFGNTSFIGSRGPNCTQEDIMPPAIDYVVDPSTIEDTTIWGTFKAHPIKTLLCVTAPRAGGNVWPLGTRPNSTLPLNTTITAPTQSTITPAKGWCLSGESKWDCISRFASNLLGSPVHIVPQSRL